MLQLGPKSSESDIRKTYIVFGSPRGGTSMVAKLLQNMNIDIGSDLPVNLEDKNFNWDFLDSDDPDEKVTLIRKSIENNNLSKSVWGWKYPRAPIYLAKVWDALINPQLICVFRDPLTISYRNIKRRGADPYRTIKAATKVQSNNMQFLQNHKESRQFLCSYEKALFKPEEFIQSLAQFLHYEVADQNALARLTSLIDPELGYDANKT